MAISNVGSNARPGVCTSTTRPTTPFEGQLIYETDTNRVLIWEGAAWVMVADTDQPPGLQLVKTVTATSQSPVNVTDAFTADYDSYKVVIIMTGVNNNNYFGMNLLDSSNNPITDTNYYGRTYGQDYAGTSTTFTTVGFNNVFTIGWLTNLSSHGPTTVTFDIHSPFSSGTRTSFQGLHTSVSTGVSYFGGACFGMRVIAEQNKGFQLNNGNATSMTGTVRVYGYRN